MQLKDKNILFLGSSITYGAQSGGVSFADIMCEQRQANMIKVAVSGTTLADINEYSYVSRLKKVDVNKKIDLFVCQLSANDATKNATIEQTEDAIRFIIEHVKENFKCPIVFYTVVYFENDHYPKMIDLLYRLQKEYGFKILDLYNDKDMRAVSKEDFKKYMADCLHPNLTGYREWWTPKFIEFCENL